MTKKNISDFTWQFFNTKDGFVARRRFQDLKHDCMYQFHVAPEEVTLGEIFDIFNSTFTDDGNFRPKT